MRNFTHTDDGMRLRQLIDAVVERTPTVEETHELEALLQSSREHRRYFRRVMGLHADLTWLNHTVAEAPDQGHPNADSGALPALIDAPVEENPLAGDAGPISAFRGAFFLPILRLANRLGMARMAAAAIILGLTAVLGAVRFFHSLQPTEDFRDTGIAVAELRSDHLCEWAGELTSIPVGTRLRSGQRLQLVKGTAKVMFDRGTSVVVESPTVFELLTPTSIHLERGTVAVKVDGPEKEFIVASPDASIVDLGTSFGVHRGDHGTTEVEVFEGAVEVHPDGRSNDRKVLGIGGAARVLSKQSKGKPRYDKVSSEVDRFGNLLEFLWEDIDKETQDDANPEDNPAIVADFSDGSVSGAVDTFDGAKRGRGWSTPWVASGNPIGEIVDRNCLLGKANRYLRLQFGQANERVVARQYGKRTGFDPTMPHVISWTWRYDGDIKNFGEHFKDRVFFCGNPFFRRNTWPTNTWLIGVVGGDETENSSLSKLDRPRQVYPRHWYAFDGQHDWLRTEFDRRNMVDTGIELKANVVYRFALVVYPQEKKYDFAIRDDNKHTFKQEGLSFRSDVDEPAQVLHFGMTSEYNSDDLRFSLDAIRIEPLKEQWLPPGFSPTGTAAASDAADTDVESDSPSDP
jgi:hypothetical protein